MMAENSQNSGEGSELPEDLEGLPEGQTGLRPEDQGFPADEAPTVVTGEVNLEDLDFDEQFEIGLEKALGDDFFPPQIGQSSPDQPQIDHSSANQPPVTKAVEVPAPPIPVSLIMDPTESALSFSVTFDPTILNAMKEDATVTVAPEEKHDTERPGEDASGTSRSDSTDSDDFANRDTIVPVSITCDPSEQAIPFSISLSLSATHAPETQASTPCVSTTPAILPPASEEAQSGHIEDPFSGELFIAAPPALPSLDFSPVQSSHTSSMPAPDAPDDGKTIGPPPNYDPEDLMEKAPESTEFTESEPPSSQEITREYSKRQLLLPLFMKTEEYNQYEQIVMHYKSELKNHMRDPQSYPRPKPPSQSFWKIFEKWLKAYQDELL